MTSLTFNSSPYKYIPAELKNMYTINGKIPIFDWYLDGTKDLLRKEWTNNYINSFLRRYTVENIKNSREGKSPYGHEVCINLLTSFEESNIKNKNVAVIGSTSPWIEAILINMNNKVTTVEYNIPECNLDIIKCRDYFNYFQKNKETFDAIVSFSSIEHSGLGRYGDPLDPDGDIKTMNSIYDNLVDKGILIWGAPVGKDALTWNAHRVYGPIRLPLVLKKFEEINWYGKTKEYLFSQPVKNNSYQPVIVLRKNNLC
tara:strand:- start:2129 stop:2899 length:771 start_codon:yes stop_codon:yes gene_type:complete